MDIQTLEHAADVFLAGPKALGDQDYKMADEMFQNLKNSNLEVSILLQALRKFFPSKIASFRPNGPPFCSIPIITSCS